MLLQRPDLEQVRAPRGHVRIDMTQICARIRPRRLQRAVAFYTEHAQCVFSS